MRLLASLAAVVALAGVGLAVAPAAGMTASTPATPTHARLRVDDVRAPSRPDYVAPLGVPVLVRGFEPPPERWGAGHRGVDLAAAIGQPVRAPGAGTVTFAGTVAGRGVVTVAHPDGLRSSMEPVDPSVEAGEAVDAGDELGEVESARGHCAPSACLHWGVRDGETYLNPLRLLRAGPSVLLPDP